MRSIAGARGIASTLRRVRRTIRTRRVARIAGRRMRSIPRARPIVRRALAVPLLGGGTGTRGIVRARTAIRVSRIARARGIPRPLGVRRARAICRARRICLDGLGLFRPLVML